MKSYKNGVIIAIITILATVVQLSAQKAPKTTDSLTVLGNCESCKKRIEKAAKIQKGVDKAVWTASTQTLVITYDAAQTNVEAVAKAVAAAGYDNAKATATADAYDKLPACCKYSRK